MVTLMPYSYSAPRCGLIDKMIEPKVKRPKTEPTDSNERNRHCSAIGSNTQCSPLTATTNLHSNYHNSSSSATSNSSCASNLIHPSGTATALYAQSNLSHLTSNNIGSSGHSSSDQHLINTSPGSGSAIGSGLNLSSHSTGNNSSVNGGTLNLSGGNATSSLTVPSSASAIANSSSHSGTNSLGRINNSELGMSHWLTESNVSSVKSENRSPGADSNILVGSASTSLLGNHLDSTALFCTNPNNTILTDNITGASVPSGNSTATYDHKQDYYNYYNSMQQYTPTFYPTYSSPYSTRAPAKIPSPNAYLPSTYTAAAAATNNNSSQLYSTYGYNNFGQFSATQQDYSSYYNEQYGNYYSSAGYSSYGVGSPGSSASHGFHVAPGALSESPSDGHLSTTPVLQHNHSPSSPLAISPNTVSSTKSTPTSKSGRARGRRHAHPSPTRSNNSETPTADTPKPPERVFIWDLDETIIIFHTLLSGSFATRYTKDPNHLLQLAFGMEELIFNMADTHFFFNEIEDCDQVHIDDVSSDDNGQDLTNYNFATDGFHTGTPQGAPPNLCLPTGVRGGVDWMRKLAFRYRKIKETYNLYRNNVPGLIMPQKRDRWLQIRSEIEMTTDNWASLTTKCLNMITQRENCVNVLVTTTQLAPALAKVLLFGLGQIFSIDNIYSAHKVGQESCFERIVTRFGRKSTYVVIGDGPDEESAAKTLNFPFWRISSHNDIRALYTALDMGFL